jgi:hypothetical protein
MTGTVGVLFTFTVMAAPLATSYLAWARHRRRIRAAWPLPAALVFAAVVTITPLRSELAGRPALVVLFAPALVLLGWGAAASSDAAVRRLPERVRPVHLVLYGILLPLLLGLGVLQTLGAIKVPAD